MTPALLTRPLTATQASVYGFIRDLVLYRGYAPTVREIGSAFGISSPNGVMCHLRALERRGLIVREPRMSRAIQLAEPERPYSRTSIAFAGDIS